MAKRKNPESSTGVTKEQKRNAILAGLRLLLIAYDSQEGIPQAIQTIITDGDTCEHMTAKQIDDLCEQVNTDGNVIKL